jgi:hypothetical protein
VIFTSKREIVVKLLPTTKVLIDGKQRRLPT